MRTALFDFHLPADAIAARPVTPRDAARLLHVLPHSQPAWVDRGIRDIPHLLQPGDVMVFNDTRVLPARLFGQRGVVPIEMLLHQAVSSDTWDAFAKPGKRLKPDQIIEMQAGLSATVIAKHDDGLVRVRFNRSGADLIAAFHAIGHMPLPPYIRRADDARDRSDYQTVYAAKDGSVAAPTAGLHFTPELLTAIDAVGVKRVQVTLHVGAGTFLPVKVDDTTEHKMHAEWAEVSAETATAINAAKRNGRRVIAVGTTSLRTLESATDEKGQVNAFSSETAIFITPGYRFKAVDILLTNFHLPKSTLFMLVSAFAGLEIMKSAYTHAIQSGYRFYSYGDASWLERAERAEKVEEQ